MPMPAGALSAPSRHPALRRPEGLARRVLAGLDAAAVRWCVLRGGAGGGDDLDVLVAAADLPRALAVLKASGLLRLPAYGRGTHVFFLGLDAASRSWVQFDLVTELAFGRHAELPTGAEDGCLDRRVRRDGVWLLRPEDEFWALLLHCLLDKRAFASRHLHRLDRLHGRTSLHSPLAAAVPAAVGSALLLRQARARKWAELESQGGALRRAWRRTRPLTTFRRAAGSAALRLLERPLQAWSRRGASVALLGPDGAGKSTLAKGIESAFFFPVRRVYMGLWQADDKPAGAAARALRVLLRPLVAFGRYLTGLGHRMLGRTAVFDRYVYDALLPPRGPLRRLKRPYFQLISRSCPRPHLVLLLDVPGRVMHVRSGEYDPAHLETERAHYRRLRQRIPDLEHVDADRPADVVLADALSRIWRHYVERAGR